MIRIVTDSTCDIPAALLAEHRVVVVPVNIQSAYQGVFSYARCDKSTGR